MSVQHSALSPVQRLLRSRPYLLASCAMAIFTYQGGRDIINVLLPAIQAEFGLNYTALGLLAASYDLGFAMLLLLGGYLSDKYGQTRIILIGLVWFVLINGAAALSTSSWILFAFRFAAGFAFATYFASGNSLLAEAFPPSERGRAIGLHYAGGSAGRFVIPLLAGMITVSAGWRLAFVPLSLTALAVGALFLLIARPAPLQPAVLAPVWQTLWGKVLRNTQLLKVCAIQFLVTFTSMAVVFVPLYLVRTWHMAVSEAAIYAGIVALLGIPASPILGELSDKLGWKKVVMSSLVLDSLLLAIFPLAAPGPALVAILAGFGVINRCISVVLAMATRASIPSERGMSLGLVNIFAIVSVTMLTVLGGAIADAAGLPITFLFISSVALLTCIALGTTRLGRLELNW